MRCSGVRGGDVAPEIHQAEGDREMSGVKHLYDFPTISSRVSFRRQEAVA